MFRSPSDSHAKVWIWILQVVLLGLLAVPATREVLVLNLRILTQMQGKTIAQGQPPSCFIHIIPNAEFSRRHCEELGTKSSESVDAYVLACFSGRWNELEPPPPESWLNHPLAIWGAFRLASAVEDRSYHGTNFFSSPSPYLPVAEETIRLLRKTHPTNGALALAEASVLFSKGDDEAALKALGVAASLREWQYDADRVFEYHKALFQAAGLTSLDASIEAGNKGGDTSCLTVCRDIRHHLNHLMRLAVIAGEDERFRELFQLVKDLQVSFWHGQGMGNYFRGFSSSDDLTRAMAERLGRVIPERGGAESYDAIRKAETEAERDFLAQTVNDRQFHVAVDPTRLARFKEAKHQTSQRCLIRSLWASAFGVLSLSSLHLAVTFALIGLHFRLLAGELSNRWLPKSRSFWLCLFPMIIMLTLWGAIIERELLQEAGMGAPNLGNEPYWSAFLCVAIAIVSHGILHRSDLPKWLRIPFAIFSDWKSWLSFSFFSTVLAAIFRVSTAEFVRQDTLFLY